ncbi:hypothetical protein [Ktedonobacter racemifer]|uniref:hypothetical protein n=1 Tax=Ktedonobacter racemifer TaxID=363277 RepID=UPI000590F5BA|nr:hypothetical protein [Ktedonobacter racemifer]
MQNAKRSSRLPTGKRRLVRLSSARKQRVLIAALVLLIMLVRLPACGEGGSTKNKKSWFGNRQISTIRASDGQARREAYAALLVPDTSQRESSTTFSLSF